MRLPCVAFTFLWRVLRKCTTMTYYYSRFHDLIFLYRLGRISQWKSRTLGSAETSIVLTTTGSYFVMLCYLIKPIISMPFLNMQAMLDWFDRVQVWCGLVLMELICIAALWLTWSGGYASVGFPRMQDNIYDTENCGKNSLKVSEKRNSCHIIWNMQHMQHVHHIICSMHQ